MYTTLGFIPSDWRAKRTGKRIMIDFDAYDQEVKYFAGIIRDGKRLDYNLPEESIDSVKMVMAEIESPDKGGARIEL